jgi:hypothetical protein
MNRRRPADLLVPSTFIATTPERSKRMGDYSRDLERLLHLSSQSIDPAQKQAEEDAAWAEYEAQNASDAAGWAR